MNVRYFTPVNDCKVQVLIDLSSFTGVFYLIGLQSTPCSAAEFGGREVVCEIYKGVEII